MLGLCVNYLTKPDPTNANVRWYLCRKLRKVELKNILLSGYIMLTNADVVLTNANV